MPPALKQNLELKAPYANLDGARQAVLLLNARDEGSRTQVDTYYHSHHGRLKLRQSQPGSAELVWYDRPNDTHLRASSYRLAPVSDPAALHAALTDALGVRGQVRKVRQVLIWHNVRIHLDEVEGLGRFVELEAVITAEDDAAASRRHLEELIVALEIDPAATLGPSYSDLLGI
jgi:predicted adenylyl cyclase CyaB